jgi:molybdate transport system substrate-binding protein
MTRMRAVALLVGVALAVGGCGGGGSGGGGKPQLVVSAAASLTAAFTQYGKTFPDANARFSFAGSDVLAAQIVQGLKPDVYAAANTTLPGGLYAQGLLQNPIVFATNELVLATPASSKIRSLADIAKPGVRLAIGSGSVPVGAYTQTVLLKLQAAKRKAILANVRSQEPDVTGIVGKLTQGAVDAGFLYATDVKATNGRLRAIHLPAFLQPVVDYAVGIVNGAHQPQAAKAFILGLLSGAGRDALHAAGFGPAPSDLRTQRPGA